MNENRYIKNMFHNIEEDIQLDIEENVMRKIEAEKDHFLVIQQYRFLSKIGMWVTVILASLLALIYLKPIFSKIEPVQTSNQESILPIVFSVLVLLLLYFQLDTYKSSRFSSKI